MQIVLRILVLLAATAAGSVPLTRLTPRRAP